MKWCCLKDKRKGKILDSNSFTQLMKNLFVVLNRHQIDYYYKIDFNATGDFHGAVLAMWDIAKVEDEKFGTHQNRAEVDINADKKVRESLAKNTINPFEKCTTNAIYLMLIRSIVFIFGRYLCTRARKELAFILWSQISFGVYQSGPDKG